MENENQVADIKLNVIATADDEGKPADPTIEEDYSKGTIVKAD